MASPPGTGVLDHMLLSTTKTSRISEEALSDEDIQQLPTEEDYSQLRRGEKRKRATSENGAETSVVATMVVCMVATMVVSSYKLQLWLQPHQDTWVDQATWTRSSHL